MMQVGGLGAVNTLVSGDKSISSTTSDSGFAGLFEALLSVNNDTQIGPVEEEQSLSKNEIQELIQFIKTDDLLDLNGGLELLNQVLSNSELDLLSMVKEYLGIEEESFKEELLAIVSKLNNLNQIPIKELGKSINNDVVDMVKTIKLFDLLSEHLNLSEKKSQFKGLTEQLSKKLEILLEDGKSTSTLATMSDKLGPKNDRLQLLYEKFAPVAAGFKKIPGNSEGQTDKVTTSPKLEVINGTVQFHQISKPEQFSLMVDKSVKAATTEDMIRQFENILSRSQFSKLGGTQKLFIKLNPEHLGSLRIELIQKDSMMIAKILTTTATAKDTIESQLNSLKQAFNSQNIQVERIEISQQMNQQDRSLNKEGHQQHNNHSRQPDKEAKEENQNDDSFELSFEDALLNMEI
ncbi:flagellar hook-length control protein FliK [Cytobacillus sp. FJAT-54145]|uniref:Flagellar hook-length control protein FliK n=1 Tax=Cytobacillus spartinae TaxID=3299023 RepID=A0ABW6K829_9BACI